MIKLTRTLIGKTFAILLEKRLNWNEKVIIIFFMPFKEIKTYLAEPTTKRLLFRYRGNQLNEKLEEIIFRFDRFPKF